MLSVEEFKTALGSAAAEYSLEEIERMRDFCDRFADLLFGTWLKRKNGHNVSTNYEEDRNTDG